MSIEYEIVSRVCEIFEAEGYDMRAYDYEGCLSKRSGEAQYILNELFNEQQQPILDEFKLNTYQKDNPKRNGVVQFVFENDDALDCLADYSISLEEILKPVNDWIKELSNDVG